jgi:hypothetical protein
MKLNPKLYWEAKPNIIIEQDFDVRYESLNSFDPDGYTIQSSSEILADELKEVLQGNSEKDLLFHLNKRELETLNEHYYTQKFRHKKSENDSRKLEAESIKSQLELVERWMQKYFDWFSTNGYSIPKLPGERTKTKQDEYFELFLGFWQDKNADPKEVKRVLNNDDKWKNPSAYLAKARKKYNVSVDELKKHPGFGWVDPKGTAID